MAKMSIGRKIWIATVSVVLAVIFVTGIVVYFQLKTPEPSNYLSIVYDTADIKKGSFVVESSDGSRDISYTYDYSDNFFVGDASLFSSDIAKFAVAMSEAAYSKETAKAALEELGYTRVVQYYFDDDGPTDPYYWKASATDYDKIPFTLATKRVTAGGKTYNFYACLIRGTQGAEWISDFDLGNPYAPEEEEALQNVENPEPVEPEPEDPEPQEKIVEHEHRGFKVACEECVLPKLAEYVLKDELFNIDASVMWVTGHSRGAAVANLVGKHLVDDKFCLDEENNYIISAEDNPNAKRLVNEEHLFDYTFACPNVKLMLPEEASESSARWPEQSAKYRGIFNIINPGDQVTALPFTDWGFLRFGTDIELDTGSSVFKAFKTRFKVVTGYNYNGETDCDKLVKAFTDWCPTYYEAAVTKDGKFDKTLLEVLKALGPIMGNQITFESISNTIEKMGFALGETGGLGGKAFMAIAEYAFNGGLNVYNGGFAQAHSLECYYSWTNSMYGGDGAVYATDLISFELTDENVTSVGTLAFYGNKYLSVVNLGTNIQRIDAFAFMGNQKLKTLIIPSSVQVVGDFAFMLSGNLQEIYFDGNCPAILSSNAFQSNTTIYIHESASGWAQHISDDKLFGCNFLYW